MRNVILLFALALLSCNIAKKENSINAAGLIAPVEIYRDSVGVNHIYAQNEHDLFFSQGYCAAKDRLFQFEIWRRQATGTIAEILGPRELNRDIGTRLFKYRGDLTKEFNHYHPNGKKIIEAFTEGVNAYIRETKRDTALLTIEFKLLGITPEYWTPEVVISRHQGLLGNLTEEVAYGRAVALAGAAKVKTLDVFEPGEPLLELDSKINEKLLLDSVISIYEAYRKPLRFKPEDLLVHQSSAKAYESLALQDEKEFEQLMSAERNTIGSNNWIVSGTKTTTGQPMLANDPHRAITAPSLRYMVHLNAPGWNVVGGGEPTIPGVSIGHNDEGAWGLTIFDIDGEDLYVYDLNPENPNQYRYRDAWENFSVIADTIKVKGQRDVFIEHQFTRHGPVTFIDSKNKKAYAVRCAWLEPGGAPYLASLRIDQAKNWEEFREACSFSHIPGENMIWADRHNNIGWQAVGIAPIRKNWSGLVPVPGDGTYEWENYLPIKSLPNILNPEKGFWATANENNVPENYEHRNAVGWGWADRYRVNRINEVLAVDKKFSQQDLMALQFDFLSLPARELTPLLKNLNASDAKTDSAINYLLNWNFVMDKNSTAAAIYSAWEKKMMEKVWAQEVPDNIKKYIRSVPLRRVIQWINSAKPNTREQFLLSSLAESLKTIELKLGSNMTAWTYGSPDYHHVLIKHPLSNAVNEAMRKRLEFGPLPRGGNGSTPGMTTNSYNQTSGASFRMVADLTDWEKTMFTNTPGQSGNPESPFYGNLFEAWANDQHVRVSFNKAKIKKAAAEKLVLSPEK